MLKAERQGRIEEMLAERGTLSVREVSDELGVSEMTIRRDLEELADRGCLVRVHGGARPAPRGGSRLLREYSHLEKRSRNVEAKRQVARTAAGLVRDARTVFLGTGTTVEQMVPLLPASHLRIVTNSLSVFNLLEGREDCELCLVGGIYRRRTAAFVGPMAEEAIASLGIEVAFVGVNGIADGVATTSNMEEGRFQQLALERARESYLVADASKVGVRDFYAFCDLAEVDALVCEPGITSAQRAEVEACTRVIF